jgi:Holliday junction resolvasome RuvABC ATP-dependent DNA helicase subunit
VQVLLLSGAPGLGKTTLAHVAAQHCGYRVVEVRARSLKAALSSRLREALLLSFSLTDSIHARVISVFSRMFFCPMIAPKLLEGVLQL